MKISTKTEVPDAAALLNRKTVRPKISVGYQVGSLTVERATEKRSKAGNVIWECRCVCGGTTLLDTRCLQHGAVRDCGCITKCGTRIRDLTGQRFGKLICIGPTEERSQNGSVMWECRCDCGNRCLAENRSLLSGYKKSCGCVGHPPVKDYIGKRFGRLTVTGYAGKRDGMHWWRCSCDCGNETEVRQTLLQSGKTRSCGCLREENLKLYEGTSVTMLEASKKKLRAHNTSGYTGVSLRKRTEKWVAYITFKGKKYSLGTFDKIEDAVKARKRAEEMHEDLLEKYYAMQQNLHDAEHGCSSVDEDNKKVE